MEIRSKILVVDDDTLVIDFVSNILMEYNYEVLAANDGDSAIKVVRKEHPDLVILDWEMPNRDGISTVKYLKSQDDLLDIPIIMITGRMNSMDDLKVAFDAGAIDFIHKPIEPIELIARTRSMLMLNGYFHELIRQKDWELTLISNTIQQNELLLNEMSSLFQTLSESIKDQDRAKYTALQTKIKKINSALKNNAWEQFQDYFKNVHPDFMDKLLAAFPKISPEELKLCHFLRLNMSSKEIASITNKEMHSVDIARYRLRKKFMLARDVKFNEFLAQF
ncbi:MAG: response regulator [Prolixibacteraceae bacterium]